MKVFVIAETEKGARELCAGARTLGDEVFFIALGQDRKFLGIADKVYLVDVPESALLESAAQTAIGILEAQGSDIILVEPTRRMLVIAGRIAAKFNTSVITDVIDYTDGVATNRFFGGIADRRQRALSTPAVYTCTAAPFGEVQAQGSDAVEEVAYMPAEEGVVLRSRDALPPADVDLTATKLIVAAGRGFTAEEDLEMARNLAALLGGELGCTRPLTEAEDWMPRETYIGVSGLMLSPETYVSLGVSGQMQHMVGVDSAKTIFAINKDKNAPIFKQADYGLVGDLYAALPQIIEQLKG